MEPIKINDYNSNSSAMNIFCFVDLKLMLPDVLRDESVNIKISHVHEDFLIPLFATLLSGYIPT